MSTINRSKVIPALMKLKLLQSFTDESMGKHVHRLLKRFGTKMDRILKIEEEHLMRYQPGSDRCERLRARTIDAVLRETTIYDVSQGFFGSTVDMFQLAVSRTRISLGNDENQLTYLLEQLHKLADREVTPQNW